MAIFLVVYCHEHMLMSCWHFEVLVFCKNGIFSENCLVNALKYFVILYRILFP